jgi:hypothetical protein
MLASKTFIGERLDLEHYKGYPIINHEITITNSDDDAFDFSIFSSITFKLFAKQHGKELAEIDVPVPDDNILILDVETMNYRPKLYYHECYGETDESPSQSVLLFHGVSEI